MTTPPTPPPPAKHTPGEIDTDSSCIIWASDGTEMVRSMCGPMDVAEANCRHIVACWNLHDSLVTYARAEEAIARYWATDERDGAKHIAELRAMGCTATTNIGVRDWVTALRTTLLAKLGEAR